MRTVSARACRASSGARFRELARGQISGSQDGLLKLVVELDTLRVIGCAVIGEGATELVHLAQMAMIQKADVNVFVDHIYNFPTLAEACRVATLDVLGQAAVVRKTVVRSTV